MFNALIQPSSLMIRRQIDVKIKDYLRFNCFSNCFTCVAKARLTVNINENKIQF